MLSEGLRIALLPFNAPASGIRLPNERVNLPCASPLAGQSQTAYNVATSTLMMFPGCTKSTAVAIRAAIRRRVGQ